MREDELGVLLAPERPRPREAFAAELDARVAARFPPRPRVRRRPALRSVALLRRPLLPAAGVLAAALAALVVALGSGGGGGLPHGAPAKVPETAAGGGGAATSDAVSGLSKTFANEGAQASPLHAPAPPSRAFMRVPGPPILAPQAATPLGSRRKVERDASVELGTSPQHVDDVAQDVLGAVARFDGIVDQSSVQTGAGGGSAQFQLRIPAARLQPALAALSQLPDAHVLARTDDTRDVNQGYVSLRRRLADARAERAGVLRALANASTAGAAQRLRVRLQMLDFTIANAERSQRALDRRVDYSRVGVAVRADAGGDGSGAFTIGRAGHDALRVLEVAVGVVVIAAAALLPVALLAALAWPLARAVRRRRREEALST